MCPDCEKAEARLARVVEFWADVEARAAEAHAAYQAEAHRRGDVRHADAYADLPEATKEWDRVLVRWVQSSIAALAAAREQPTLPLGHEFVPGLLCQHYLGNDPESGFGPCGQPESAHQPTQEQKMGSQDDD